MAGELTGPGRIGHQYQACGFTISSDLALPMATGEADSGAVPLNIRRTDAIDQQGEAIGPFAHAGDGWLAYSVPGLVDFYVSKERGIAYRPHANTDGLTIASFVLNSALPCAAMLGGLTTLRGAAVERDGKAILLIGPTASGKSAVAAELARRGMPLLSDHVALIADEAQTMPGIPTLTLPADCAAAMGVDLETAQPTRPGLKRYHWPEPLAGSGLRSVSAIYQLFVHTSPDIAHADIRGTERLNVLRNCSFRPTDLHRFGGSEALLRRTSALSARCAFRRVWRPVLGLPVADLADWILSDLEAMEAAS